MAQDLTKIKKPLKIAATIVLLILVSFPFLIAPWMALPFSAGAFVAFAFYRGIPSWPIVQKIMRGAKAIAVGAAVVIAVWFAFFTQWKSPHTSIASKANLLISKLPGESQPPRSQTIAAIEADRLSLQAALQMERQRITVISRALNLFQVARAEYQAQANAGTPDDKLAAALKEFETLFATERPDPTDSTKRKTMRLLAPDQLDAHLLRASNTIDRLEAEGTLSAADSQAIRRFKLGIPSALSSLQLDPLYLATTNLQDRLKSTLKVRLSAESTYVVRFDRVGNTLTSQQDTRIRLAENPVSDIDLTGFFTSSDGQLGENLKEEVRIQEDSSPEQLVSPKQPVFQLSSGAKSILISKRIIRHGAAEPVSPGLLPLQFSLIRIDWPLPRTHAVTLGLQEPGNPNSTWPFILPIETRDDAALARIVLPRYSFYFSDPAMDKVSTTASTDELIPAPTVGKLRALLPGSAQTIRVEISPRYLSNSPSQKIKDLFAIENILAAIIIWLITVVGFGAFKL